MGSTNIKCPWENTLCTHTCCNSSHLALTESPETRASGLPGWLPSDGVVQQGGTGQHSPQHIHSSTGLEHGPHHPVLAATLSWSHPRVFLSVGFWGLVAGRKWWYWGKANALLLWWVHTQVCVYLCLHVLVQSDHLRLRNASNARPLVRHLA